MNNGYGKVEISPNRHDWDTTPLPEQVVLVTTVDAEERPHVATKSRISVVSYGPPTMLMFACRADYLTAKNIETTGQFVINVPGYDLVATSWVIGSDPSSHGPGLLSDNGLTPIPSLKVGVPRIAECRAHLECEVEATQGLGPELAVFGKVIAVTMNRNIAESEEDLSYRRLAPFFFLNPEWTGPLGAARRVYDPVPGPRHDLTILATSDLGEAVQFYTRAFDWPIRIERKEYVEFELPGGRGLALCTRDEAVKGAGARPTEPAEDELGSAALHFACEDLPRVLARMVAAGARELSELKKRDDSWEAAFFADPDGNVLVIGRRLNQEL